MSDFHYSYTLESLLARLDHRACQFGRDNESLQWCSYRAYLLFIINIFNMLPSQLYLQVLQTEGCAVDSSNQLVLDKYFPSVQLVTQSDPIIYLVFRTQAVLWSHCDAHSALDVCPIWVTWYPHTHLKCHAPHCIAWCRVTHLGVKRGVLQNTII